MIRYQLILINKYAIVGYLLCNGTEKKCDTFYFTCELSKFTRNWIKFEKGFSYFL